jgi:replicative DNA helicase Mcm
VDVSVVSKWEGFFQGTEYIQKVREVADLYPEMRSVKVVYADLDRFDADLAAYLLEHPDLCLLAGKQALKNLMHQEMRRADINLRLIKLPRDSRVEIRDLRAKHVGKLISVEGLVRKATEVRPKITDALFQCLRCGHVIKEPQEGLYFKEPMECYKEQDGCGRSAGSTKFKLLTEDSRFVDTQKVEIQESPEGLRGGAQPERLTGYLEDDAAGSVAPGDRVVLNGILRSVQKGQPAKSPLFDINLDIISGESQRTEYEEIHITPEDEARIVEVAHSPDVFRKIVASISPTIYGYDTEKEALALQLFGGVPNNLDDGTRIRGDIHILLIGDPGVAKCVTGDAEVSLADGTSRRIREMVEEALASSPSEVVDDGLTAPVDIPVLTLSSRGRIEAGRAVRVWKRTAPATMVRVGTGRGRSLTVTPPPPLFARGTSGLRPTAASPFTWGPPSPFARRGGRGASRSMS